MATEDVPGGFWADFGLNTSTGLLSASALYLSVRCRVPNLAVTGIALFAPIVAGKTAGPGGSVFVVLGLAVVIGIVIGIALVGLVLGLQIPAWGASLGVTGLLIAWSTSLVDNQQLEVAVGNSIGAWGIPLLIVSAALAIGFAVASPAAVAPAGSGLDRAAADAPERDTQMVTRQAVAIVVSSAIAAVAGALFVLRTTVLSGQSGLDLTRPLSILLLSAASLRGRGSGVIGLVAAAIAIDAASILLIYPDGTYVDHLLITGGLACVGLIVGGVLELISTGRSQSMPTPLSAPTAPTDPST
jgi:hypothetical protein